MWKVVFFSYLEFDFKNDGLLVSQHISRPRIDSYWSCEMVQYVSEEEQREFSAPRSLLHLGEIVQVVGERQMS